MCGPCTADTSWQEFRISGRAEVLILVLLFIVISILIIMLVIRQCAARPSTLMAQNIPERSTPRMRREPMQNYYYYVRHGRVYPTLVLVLNKQEILLYFAQKVRPKHVNPQFILCHSVISLIRISCIFLDQ